MFFFFKQKTAYEMRISDWSSDVCSSDLNAGERSSQKSQPGVASLIHAVTLPLLILRPEPGASMTAGRATALGLQPVCYPLFYVRPCVWAAPDPAEFDAIMLTSANALLPGGPQLHRFKHLPSLPLGNRKRVVVGK